MLRQGRGGRPATQEADAEGDPGRRRGHGEEGGIAWGRGDGIGPLVLCVWEREGEVGRAVVEDEREREMGSGRGHRAMGVSGGARERGG